MDFMHALQNYKQPEPAYDGNAYMYSSTCHAGTGTLQLYTHHVMALGIVLRAHGFVTYRAR